MFNNSALAPIVPAGIFRETGPRPGGTPVNGRTAWISENNLYAIWHVPDDNTWVVGFFLLLEMVDLRCLKGKMQVVHKKLKIGKFLMVQDWR